VILALDCLNEFLVWIGLVFIAGIQAAFGPEVFGKNTYDKRLVHI
jgi:hypothetical protein